MPKHIPTYRLHGLSIRSDLPLHAPLEENAVADLDVSWGENVAIPSVPPAGRVIAGRCLGNGSGYSLTETQDGHTLRFYGICEFRIARDRRSVRVQLAPETNPEMACVLFAGNLIAVLLGLAGHAVLHASTVEVGGAALAFVGNSGMGKSTLAALLCAGGARLITDDLLRVEANGDGYHCFPGTSELRLRTSAVLVADQFPAACRAPTIDGRIGVRLANKEARGPLPALKAIVIPHPSRACEALRLERLTIARAHFRLLAFPRVGGWLSQEPKRRQFQALAGVAQRVPVFEAEVPWGPPFSPELSAALLASLGFEHHLAPIVA